LHEIDERGVDGATASSSVGHRTNPMNPGVEQTVPEGLGAAVFIDEGLAGIVVDWLVGVKAVAVVAA